MVGNNVARTKSEVGRSLQKLSIEKACQEYNNSVKVTLDRINHQLDEVLLKNCNGLDELAMKIAARTNFLEKNPSFLSCLVYDKKNIKRDALLEFDDIRITLKEHSKRIQEKLEDIERYHSRLLDLVEQNGQEETASEASTTKSEITDCATSDSKVVDEETGSSMEAATEETKTCAEDDKTATPETETCPEPIKTPKEEDEDFQDCIDKFQQNPITDPESANLEVSSSHTCESEKTNPTNTKNPEKKNSYDKVTIKKGAYSDMNLKAERTQSPVKFQLFPDVLPDVSRRRPIEDLHGKLVQQLVASDSLEGFLKLMDRKPTKEKLNRRKKEQKETDLEQKYTGSLWFFPKEQKKKQQNKSASTKISPIPQKNSRSCSSSGSTCCSLIVTSSQPCPTTNQERSRKIRNGLSRNKLKYYDLLDDLDHNDLKPIESEYPRRDNVYPLKLQEAKSYLHRMMQENENVWKKLLQPIEDTKEREKKKRQTESRKKQPQVAKKNGVKTLLEYLTSPEQKYLDHIPQSLIVMPVKIIYDNFPTRDDSESPRGAVLITDLTKVAEPRRIPTSDVPTVAEAPRTLGFPIQKRKAMLEQLKGLKMRNDNIQKNIQKAIDVIEAKMIDLLSSPTDATSQDAFNAMEKEITSVLQMMNENETADKGDMGDRKKVEEEKKVKVEEEKEVKVEKEMKVKVEEEKKVKAGEEKKVKVEEEKKIKEVDKQEPPAEKEEKRVENTENTKEEQKEEQKIVEEKIEAETHQLNEQQLQPEKDNNVCISPTVLSPKLRREATIVKKTTRVDFKIEADAEIFGRVEKVPEVKKHKDEVKEPKIIKEERKPHKDVHNRIRYSFKEERSSKKADKAKGKISKHEDTRKAANIEEGERLLGQVDNVIKKIDSIYNRFYDENSKTKFMVKPEANFTISDFFDGLKPSTETPIEIEYKYHEMVPEVYHKPISYRQASVWWVPRWENTQTAVRTVKKKAVKARPAAEKEEVKPREHSMVPVSVLQEEPKSRQCIHASVSLVPKELKSIHTECSDSMLLTENLTRHYICIHPSVPKEQFIAELREDKCKENSKEVEITRIEKFRTKSQEVDRRHDYTLKTFYTLFFSSIFVALNFDYTS